MGRGGTGQVDPLPAPRGGRRQVGAHELALERPHRGDGQSGQGLEEMDADQAGSPGRMLAAQAQRGLLRVGARGLDARRPTLIGRDPVGAEAAEPRQETTDGRLR
jgi:hypothetical protein